MDNDRMMPLLIGAGLIGAGLALRGREPSFLSLPEPAALEDNEDAGALTRAAMVVRDRVDDFAPNNLMSTIARSLLISGASMIVVRMLDEIAAADWRS